MKVKDLVARINNFNPEDELVIYVKRPGSIGALPSVPIKSIGAGIDWDNGKVIVYPEVVLSKADLDLIEQVRQLTDKLGWAEYEKDGLKSEIKRLKKELLSKS